MSSLIMLSDHRAYHLYRKETDMRKGFTEQGHPQLSLDIPTEPAARVSVTGAQKISYVHHTLSTESKPLQHPGRMKLPESLRREQIIIEPVADTNGCKKMGEEITEVLEY